MWLESIQTGPVRTSLDDYRPKALESVVSKLQQSGVPGPMMLFGDPEYLGQGSQFIVYKQRMAITEYHGFSTRDIAAKQPKYDINPDIRLSLSDETVRKHLNDIYLELYALTIPTLGTHPNIVRLFGWSFDPSSFHAPPLLIMELAGSNILTLLSDRSSNISDNTKYNLCCNIGAGLDALHDHGIVHGDLKPENVLIFPSKGRLTAKLADFGLSINEGEGPRKPQILGGTRGWMAPEVEASTALEPEAMFKADNYSCGLLTWSIAIYCGQPPPSSNARSLHMIAEGELQRARETSHHHMYSILASAVKNLLQPDCLDRPSRVSPLLGDTEEACDAA
jgi:serine/threonine protein kinase